MFVPPLPPVASLRRVACLPAHLLPPGYTTACPLPPGLGRVSGYLGQGLHLGKESGKRQRLAQLE